MTFNNSGQGCKFSGNIIFKEIFRKYEQKAGSYNVHNFHSNSPIFPGAVLEQVIFFLNIMQKVNTECCFVNNMLIFRHHFAMLDLKNS